MNRRRRRQHLYRLAVVGLIEEWILAVSVAISIALPLAQNDRAGGHKRTYSQSRDKPLH